MLFRYLFIPNIAPEAIDIRAMHEYLPLHNQATFKSDDSVMNRIWDISIETFTLCSGLFFIDGIKRDRWIWSGMLTKAILSTNTYSLMKISISERSWHCEVKMK